MERVVSALLVIVGLINFLPVAGVLSVEILANAYNIPQPEGDLLILMRHRAVLFGILGAIIIVSAFRRHLQTTATLAAFISMLGFIGLCLASGKYGEKIYNVMLVDIAGCVLLAVVVFLRFFANHQYEEDKPGTR